MISIVAVHPPSPGAPESSEGEVEGRGREIDRDTCDTMEAMPSDITTQLGQQLQTAREAAGMTQAQAAELAGVTRQRWGQMEAGSVSNLNKLHAACTAIGAVPNFSIGIPTEE